MAWSVDSVLPPIRRAGPVVGDADPAPWAVPPDLAAAWCPRRRPPPTLLDGTLAILEVGLAEAATMMPGDPLAPIRAESGR